MNRYIVYRHGWNETNQKRENGLPEKMAVARVEAETPEEACRHALREVTVEPAQYLSAELADPIDARVTNLNRKAEALDHPPIKS